MFTKEWHTETETVTDEAGRARFRGFYGDYELNIASDGKMLTKTLTLSSRKNNVNKIVLD